MKIHQEEGGAAFPTPDCTNWDGPSRTPGMSLRDWFAGRADIPWNAVIETLGLKGNYTPTVGEIAATRSEMKYIEADAMLAERMKEKP